MSNVIDLDKEEIAEAIKILKNSLKDMEKLQKHNFSGLYDDEGNGPSPNHGYIPAKYRLMNLAHEIIKSGADILRFAADLNDE